MKFNFGNGKTDAKKHSTFQKKLSINKEMNLNSPSDFLPANEEVPLLYVQFTQLSKGDKVEITASAGWTAGFPCEPAEITLTVRRNQEVVVAQNSLTTQDLQQQNTATVTGSEELTENLEVARYTLYASTEQAGRIRMSDSFKLLAIVRLAN
ncbi:hypothetical protein [Fictibacillus sp. KU28468]|uniref:hypothetical protein n=1 Tax=Fictibacillus sp. KU28468 TaxID=2991053 RepID=UPI00223CEF73|nr:hypothetical protein [Fictibacillus sp. KU28468]UZJ78011.1 hypothetical protein OKX00_17925 [Fictibacillus sp. KU28468]